MSLGCAIISFNEESIIERCLNAVSFCDEIVVVDSYSTDSTYNIARQYTNKLYLHNFEDYARQKNFAMSKLSTDWILSIDADEIVTDELREEIIETLKNANNETFLINIQLIFMGKPLRFGGTYPDYHLRLFKKGYNFENSVHEGINAQGQKMKNKILHYSYDNLEDYFNKFNKYTSLIAESNIKKRKYISRKRAFLRIILELFKRFILKRAFLDGYEGCVYALLSSFYSFIKYAKTIEMQKK